METTSNANSQTVVGLGSSDSLGPFVFWVWFQKNGGAWKKANHTATSKEHAMKIMSFFQDQNKRNGRTDLKYVVSDVLPNAQDQRDGCLAQAVPSTDCDKQSASLHRMVRLLSHFHEPQKQRTHRTIL